MSLATKALWIIERNSDQPLSLTELARTCGVTRSHLAHAFASSTGIPVMKYLRGRRLSRAAQQLADGAPDILSVALDAGYNSHEAFTRAFREQFSLTPESLRERGSVDGLPLTAPLELKPGVAQLRMRPKIVEQRPLLVVGLSAPYSYANTIGIPAQWQQFMSVCDDVEHHAGSIPVGVAQVPDDEGQFRYLCGLVVSRFGKIPPGLEPVKISAGRYAVFEHSAHVSSIYDTYERIWNESLPESGYQVAESPIIERHNPTFNPATGEGGLTLWIPLATNGVSDEPLRRNSETVASYSRYAPGYAEATKDMSPDGQELLGRFAAALPRSASVIDIGSGPGWDADYLEALGHTVRRTDAAPGFVELQRARGKTADVVNLVTDELGGPYDGALLLYVLQHIDAPLLDGVLAKLAASLRIGGVVLFTYRNGDGTLTEHGTTSGDYHSTLRRPEAFRAAMDRVGLTPHWERRLVDEEGVWQVVLASRTK